MNRTVAILTAAALAFAPAVASAAPPQEQALVQMVQEAAGREVQALTRVYALEAQVKDLQAQIAKKAEPPVEPAPEK